MRRTSPSSCASRGHEVEVVTTADAPPPDRPYPVRAVRRQHRPGVRHYRGAALVQRRAREGRRRVHDGDVRAQRARLERCAHAVRREADRRSRVRAIASPRPGRRRRRRVPARRRRRGVRVSAVRARRRAPSRGARLHAERVSPRAHRSAGASQPNGSRCCRIRRPRFRALRPRDELAARAGSERRDARIRRPADGAEVARACARGGRGRRRCSARDRGGRAGSASRSRERRASSELRSGCASSVHSHASESSSSFMQPTRRSSRRAGRTFRTRSSRRSSVGTPVLAMEAGGVAEVVRDEVNGLLVAAGRHGGARRGGAPVLRRRSSA